MTLITAVVNPRIGGVSENTENVQGCLEVDIPTLQEKFETILGAHSDSWSLLSHPEFRYAATKWQQRALLTFTTIFWRSHTRGHIYLFSTYSMKGNVEMMSYLIFLTSPADRHNEPQLIPFEMIGSQRV